MSLSWLPNAITIVRIALIVPVVWGIQNGQPALALAAFMLAGFSDLLDGYLAKRFAWHSRLGALLDPLADKFLIAASFLSLAAVSQLPVWLALTVVIRDAVIIGGATAYNFLIAPVPGEPTLVSKINTAMELLLVVCVLSESAFRWPGPLVTLVVGAGVFATVVVSGIDYVVRWSRRARAAAASGVESL